jgi:asparagine synthase (glutamine-hydrolysing)
MYRYLSIVWNPHNSESARRAQAYATLLTSRPEEWPIAFRIPGILIVHTGIRTGSTGSYVLRNSGGVVLGTLFRNRSEAPTPATFDEAESARVVATRCKHLTENYWGTYVAFVHDRETDSCHILREPTANLPCYHTRDGGVDVFFSHVEDCLHFLPIKFSINRGYLAKWLVVCRLIGRDCGLADVAEIPGGERVTIRGGEITRSLLWDPISVARAVRFTETDTAASALRAAVHTSVNAWTSCYRNVAHRLSGGLDSSIVAGCLAHAPSHPRLTFLHFAIDVAAAKERFHFLGMSKETEIKARAIVGHGDERHFARLVAERWNVPLIEKPRTIHIDLARMWTAPLMISPATYFAAMEGDDAEMELVKKEGIQAFFSGQAGDSVLFATQQPVAAIDYAYLHGLDAGTWRQVQLAASLSKESIWSVLGKTLKYGVLGREYESPIRFLDQPTMLTSATLETLRDSDFVSDWVSLSGAHLPPGKQMHVRGLTGSASYDSDYHTQAYADYIDPLNAQPVWELMLQIPSYTMLAGGVSRGLARKAFADILPSEIRKRQIKGTGAAFYQQVVRRNRNYLREVLLGGLLVEQGYLDQEQLRACLMAEEPFLRVGALDLLCYLAAEIWLRRWKEICEGGGRSQLMRSIA